MQSARYHKALFEKKLRSIAPGLTNARFWVLAVTAQTAKLNRQNWPARGQQGI